MSEESFGQVEITYYTDPLCCWSWAMEPQWRRLRYEFRGMIRWRYCMGGLLPNWKTYTDSLHSISRPVQMGPLWMEATHLSGMPINNKIWVDNPPASSYLACIAVKCAELQSQEAGESYLRLLRESVMMHAKDISLLSTLVDIARALSERQPGAFDAVQFENDMKTEKGVEAFRSDLNEVRTKNIKRFPTMIFRRQGQPSLLLSGYRPYVVLLDIMNRIAPDVQRMESIDPTAFRNYWGNVIEREEKEVLV